MNPIVTNFHKPAGAPLDATRAAIRRLRTFIATPDVLAALGLDDRVVPLYWCDQSGAVGFKLVWRSAYGRRAEIAWTVSATSDGDDGSLIFVKAVVTCEHAAWRLLSPIAEAEARRMLTAVAELADVITAEEPVAASAYEQERQVARA